MRAILTGVTLLITTFTSSSAESAGCRALLESDVKIAAMRSYADILALAARNGWNYPPEAIDNGARRHFEEMKVRLSAIGYLIVPAGQGTLSTGRSSAADGSVACRYQQEVGLSAETLANPSARNW
jgi:hypothetical protein